MMSISKFQTQESAQNYFQKDLDYYQKNQELGAWDITPKLSEFYGIENGELINKDSYVKFASMLSSANHTRSGFDITFSASKSISAIYAAANESTREMIRAAQEKAVSRALEYARQYITFRERDRETRESYVCTELAIAKFNHYTNREEESQLHTHCFVFNKTLNNKNEIVSIDNYQLYKNQKLITQIYHQELFSELAQLGFDIEIRDLSKDIFEIKDVTQEQRDALSTRTAQVNAYLEENREELLKKYENASEAKLREIATLASRKRKLSHDYDEISNIEARNRAVLARVALTEEVVESLKKNKEKREVLSAEELIAKSAEILTSKESTFTKEEILSTAIKLNATQNFSVSIDSLENAILSEKNIVQLDTNIYTTSHMQAIEQEILTVAFATQNTTKAETSTEHAQAFLDKSKYSTMTKGQKEAFAHVLTSTDQILGIQGDAGVGKTYMLKAIKEFQDLQARNNLIGLAPTNKAAQEITKESGIAGQTIDSFLLQKDHEKDQIIIVDEASMIDSQKMRQLVEIAVQSHSKLVLIGDVKQFQSIAAGGIFQQLQKHKAMSVAIIAESMRAKTEEMRELYKLSKEFRIEEAINKLDAKSQFKEIIGNDYSQAIQDYLQDRDNKPSPFVKTKFKLSLIPTIYAAFSNAFLAS